MKQREFIDELDRQLHLRCQARANLVLRAPLKALESELRGFLRKPASIRQAEALIRVLRTITVAIDEYLVVLRRVHGELDAERKRAE
jgi:hypothetical protein